MEKVIIDGQEITILSPEELQKRAMQSLPQMVGSLGSSLGGFIINGFKVATPEQLESRMEICKGCEFWDASGFVGTGKCQKCGCSTQAKLRMATSKCPVDKWGPVTPDQKQDQVS